MHIRHIVVAGLLGIVAYMAYTIYDLRRQLREATLATSALKTEMTARVRALTTEAQNKDRLLSSEREAAQRPERTRAFQALVDEWIERVVSLNEYLDAHPELRIPQMQTLTQNDWLQVANERDLDTEAGYRRALAILRSKAKVKFVPQINEAWKKAILEADGKVPEVAALAKHLPAGFDIRILDELQINTSGEVPGLKYPGQKTDYFLADRRRDLWDAMNYYSTTGGAAGRSHDADGEMAVMDAMKQYKAANGVNPTDASQISTYKGMGKQDTAKVNEMLKAYNTPMRK